VDTIDLPYDAAVGQPCPISRGGAQRRIREVAELRDRLDRKQAERRQAWRRMRAILATPNMVETQNLVVTVNVTMTVNVVEVQNAVAVPNVFPMRVRRIAPPRSLLRGVRRVPRRRARRAPRRATVRSAKTTTSRTSSGDDGPGGGDPDPAPKQSLAHDAHCRGAL
jgi:hypothetical protein